MASGAGQGGDEGIDLVTGNARSANTEGTGWFLGFSPWTHLPGSELLHVPRDQRLSGLCAKWFDHVAGHESGDDKPVSEGRTISILISTKSRFELQFSRSPAFRLAQTLTVELVQPGDYAAWGSGLFHRWRCRQRSTILTIRWSPADGA